MGGYGIATNYTWKEDAYEMDVSVSVPPGTRASDIYFKATSTSIDLQLRGESSSSSVTLSSSLPNNNSALSSSGDKNKNDESQQTQRSTTLLDPKRALRGRINVDGTYWVISDPDDKDVMIPVVSSQQQKPPPPVPGSRYVTVTIEKMIATPMDDFAVVDYDWKGLYAVEDADEILERKYDAAEPLDVRQYAASMGVDIDNINMSMVDKTMFNSGLNLTQRTLDELNQAGYLSKQEVTQQLDGTEYTVNEDSGEPELVSSSSTGTTTTKRPVVPFIDTDSPPTWNTADTTILRDTTPPMIRDETVIQQTRNFTRAAFAEDSAKRVVSNTKDNPKKKKAPTASLSQDPIDDLTVERLKEILKSQGLKTTGTKSILQERLRNQVNALLQGNQQQDT